MQRWDTPAAAIDWLAPLCGFAAVVVMLGPALVAPRPLLIPGAQRLPTAPPIDRLFESRTSIVLFDGNGVYTSVSSLGTEGARNTEVCLVVQVLPTGAPHRPMLLDTCMGCVGDGTDGCCCECLRNGDIDTLSARTALLNDWGVPRPLLDGGFCTETIGGDVHEGNCIPDMSAWPPDRLSCWLLFAEVATTADGMPPKTLLLVPSRGAYRGDGPKRLEDCEVFVSAEERLLTR